MESHHGQWHFLVAKEKIKCLIAGAGTLDPWKNGFVLTSHSIKYTMTAKYLFKDTVKYAKLQDFLLKQKVDIGKQVR